MDPLVAPPRDEPDWLGLTDEQLPVVEALAWASDPASGALVLFCGVVRDHAEGRQAVTGLEYEAYEERVVPRLVEIAAEAHRRWPALARLVAVHRVGALAVGDVAVIVVAATPHRHDAFEAARWTIDTVKASLPIWKLESWEGGRAWSEAAQAPVRPGVPLNVSDSALHVIRQPPRANDVTLPRRRSSGLNAMPEVRLRLFGPAKDSAGASSATLAASTVAELLDQAVARYGATLDSILPSCRVWVNGEEAEIGQALQPGDEVAILPPVSGG